MVWTHVEKKWWQHSIGQWTSQGHRGRRRSKNTRTRDFEEKMWTAGFKLCCSGRIVICLYDAALWSNFHVGMLNKLRSSYNRCIKIFFGLTNGIVWQTFCLLWVCLIALIHWWQMLLCLTHVYGLSCVLSVCLYVCLFLCLCMLLSFYVIDCCFMGLAAWIKMNEWMNEFKYSRKKTRRR